MAKLPENVQKWVQELRSGEHIQTTETLKRHAGSGQHGYCCLGVYVEKVKGFPVRAVAKSNDHDEGAMKWYELCDKELGSDLKQRVANLNDNGKSFEEIADFVEEWYEKEAKSGA